MEKDRRKDKTLQTALSTEHSASSPDRLGALYSQYHEGVFRAAYRVTGNAGDAEDVLQTIFMRLLKREEIPDLQDRMGAYLRRAAVNAALDVLRSRKVSRSLPLGDAEFQLEDPRDLPDERHRASRLRERLRDALAALNPRAAEMFVLRYIEGYSNREIAQLLETSPGTVAVTLHRSRSRLKQEFSEEN